MQHQVSGPEFEPATAVSAALEQLAVNPPVGFPHPRRKCTVADTPCRMLSGAFGIKNVPAVVPDEDKEAYWRIYSELLAAS